MRIDTQAQQLKPAVFLGFVMIFRSTVLGFMLPGRVVLSISPGVVRHPPPLSLDWPLNSSPEQKQNKNPGFDWESEWYPVSPVQDLAVDSPNRITLLGMDFAVWFHKPSQQWRAFADRCPHRLVPLSEGRIEDSSNGVLQCAYHGWEFDADGRCTRIPQLDSSNASPMESPRACATSFPVRIEQHLLWIFPKSDELLARTKQPALIAELDDPENIDGTNFFVRDMPYSWDILVENLCDPAHVPFAHHSFMRGADRNLDTLQMDMKLTEATNMGFRAQKDPYPAGNGSYDVQFQAPCLLYYYIANSSALGKDSSAGQGKPSNFIGLGQYCVPTGPGRSRLIARFPLRIGFKPAMFILRHTPRWMTHFTQNVVMDSDVIFLASQDEATRADRKEGKVLPTYYMPAQCDAMVIAFRKWLQMEGGGEPRWLGASASRSSGEPLGWIRPQEVAARRGRDELLDRYRQHTDICASCRKAHKSLYILREVLRSSAVATLIGVAVATKKQQKLIMAVISGIMFATPRFVLRPIIARMECAPWPRKKWLF